MRSTRMMIVTTAVLAAASCASPPTTNAPLVAPFGSGWEVVGGGHDNIKYSPFTQINRSNVARLEVAWRYDTGEGFKGSEMQTNPIVIGRTLYAVTPKQRLIALDAAEGRLIWKFDPHDGKDYSGASRNRGVAYWSDGNSGTIFYAAGQWLYAVDARSGTKVAGFGDNGRIDLREGLDRDPATISVSATSPGVVYKDVLIIGSSLAEDLPAAPGDIRAFDVHTGKLRWSFRTIPAAGEPGAESWPEGARQTSGGANSWAGLSLDAERGIVFAPTGSAAFDFWGGDRLGDNLYANSLLALNAETGDRIWSFQTVHHDIWDRDLPTPPSLVQVQHDGRLIDAVAQITKTGYVYLFDRLSGKPLFPVTEVPAPQSDMPGERTAPTQPRPLLPPPFARQRFDPSNVTSRDPEARAAILKQLAGLRSSHLWEPPSLQGTIVYPGLDGGGEWGGGAFDPQTGLFYVNSNEMAWLVRLLKREQPAGETTDAASIYEANCSGCHGADRRGTPGQFPALHNLSARMQRPQVERTISEGAPRMPAFASLGRQAISAIAGWLLEGENSNVAVAPNTANQLPYRLQGYDRVLDPEGYPATAMPWGRLSAIDLNRGAIKWQVPFGEVPQLVAQGMRDTGSENYGGPVVTAGGLLFIGATILDRKFRAYDKASGRLLWETLLPFSATATPAVYSADGRQFVVIASGGGKAGQPSGGTYVAFALPRSGQR